jgi:hypothetical protein
MVLYIIVYDEYPTRFSVARCRMVKSCLVNKSGSHMKSEMVCACVMRLTLSILSSANQKSPFRGTIGNNKL